MIKVRQYSKGILISEYPMHARVGLKDVKQELADRISICKEPHCVMTILHGVALITEEAEEFLISLEITEMTKAVAVVIDPQSGYYENANNILWRIKNMDKPKYRFEVFDNKDSALEWLNNCCNDVPGFRM